MKKFKVQIKKIFDETKEVSCPAFPNEKVIFNAKGINHLIYKGGRSRREKSRILTNIRLLSSAIKLLTWRKDRFGILNAKSRHLEKE